VVLLLSFWGASISTPLVANVKFPIIYVVDVQIIMVLKRVYGLSGCHREGLVCLVRYLCHVGCTYFPHFVLLVGCCVAVHPLSGAGHKTTS